MVIYADVLFLANFISAYILLSLLGKFIVKSKIKIWRLCISSAVGAMTAVTIFTMDAPNGISYLIRALSAFIMVFISFYEKKRQILSELIWLAAVSAMLIAAMIILVMVTGRTVGAVVKSGVVYFDMPQKIFLPMLILSYVTVTLFMKITRARRAKQLYAVTVTHNGKNISVTALFDSGNLLREPVTGKGVSLVEWDTARKLFGVDCPVEDMVKNVDGIKLYVVPYRTVGEKRGIIYAFRADSIEIADGHRLIGNVLVGLYDGKLSEKNEYNALLSAELI